MIKISASFLALGAALLATPSYATAQIDPYEFTGFVSRGDVKNLYGLSIEELSDQFVDIDFRMYHNITYAVTCAGTGADGQALQRTFNLYRRLYFGLTGYGRQSGSQVTGYDIAFNGTVVAVDDPLIPIAGMACPTQFGTGTAGVTQVVEDPPGTRTFELYAYLGGEEKRMDFHQR